jgi:hypothetical protein
MMFCASLLCCSQAARKSQQQLAQQVAQLQAQPPQAPTAQPLLAAAEATAHAAAAESSRLDEQQQPHGADDVQSTRVQQAAAAEVLQPSRRCSNCRSAKRISSSDDGGSAVGDTWQPDSSLADLGCGSAGCQEPGQLLCLSGDQLAVMSSWQGRAQAQLELLQQQLQKQQVSCVTAAAAALQLVQIAGMQVVLCTCCVWHNNGALISLLQACKARTAVHAHDRHRPEGSHCNTLMCCPVVGCRMISCL